MAFDNPTLFFSVVPLFSVGQEVENFILKAAEGSFSQVGHLWLCQVGGDLRRDVGEGLVDDWIDSHSQKKLLELGVPLTLNVLGYQFRLATEQQSMNI